MQSELYGVEDATWEDGLLTGAYWVRRQHASEPELAYTFESGLFGLNENEEEAWDTNQGEPAPEILFGPLIAPTDVSAAG